MTVCTFAGYREVFSSTVESEIDRALIEIIEADRECVFYSNGMSDFDRKCKSTVRGMKRKYPERNTRLVRVLPYLTHEINHNKEYSESYCDGIVVPMELTGVYYKAAIKKRNRWMVDQADKILAYIYRGFEGVFDTTKHACHMGKPALSFVVKE